MATVLSRGVINSKRHYDRESKEQLYIGKLAELLGQQGVHVRLCGRKAHAAISLENDITEYKKMLSLLTCPSRTFGSGRVGSFTIFARERGGAIVSLKKQYPKAGSECKVTFSLSTESAGSAGTAYVVGDFNNWDPSANPMKRLKDGSFTATINLKKNQEYQFRYLLDGKRWENDWNADKYVANEHGSENSAVIT